MKELLKYYKWDILLVVAFIVFTFIYPIPKASIFVGMIIALYICDIVGNDKRIQNPYSTILQIAIIVGMGIFLHHRFF